jgi:hypothetical protein
MHAALLFLRFSALILAVVAARLLRLLPLALTSGVALLAATIFPIVPVIHRFAPAIGVLSRAHPTGTVVGDRCFSVGAACPTEATSRGGGPENDEQT